MKFSQLTFAAMLLLASLIRADAQNATAPATPAPAAPAAADSALPATGGYPADRYAILWTKSPFAVATSETVGEESPDYILYGVANQDGIFYASVVERQNQEHFLLSSDKPVRGLTLKSINRTKDGLSTFAEVTKDGQPLTLKLEQASAATPGAPGMGVINAPAGGIMQQIPMPGAASGFPNGASVRPFTRFHRPAIHLPPQPAQAAPAAPATPTSNTPPPPPAPPQ
jgi:hypothetical protein